MELPAGSCSAPCAGRPWSRSRRIARPSAPPAAASSCTCGEATAAAAELRRGKIGRSAAFGWRRSACGSVACFAWRRLLPFLPAHSFISACFPSRRRCASRYLESRVRQVLTNTKAVEKHKVGGGEAGRKEEEGNQHVGCFWWRLRCAAGRAGPQGPNEGNRGMRLCRLPVCAIQSAGVPPSVCCSADRLR